MDEVRKRYIGRCKWFSADRCFGFIELPPEEDGTRPQDVFVHYRGIRGTGYRNLKEGQIVDFEVVGGPKGDQANDCVVVAEPGDDYAWPPAKE